MAEISSPKISNKGVSIRKIRQLKVDLTPMVDLGFILITFFVFTTSMSQPTSMKVIFPDDRTPDSSKVANEKTFNVVLGKGMFGYYNGDSIAALQKTSSLLLIREVMRKKRSSIAAIFGDPRELVVLIKPCPESSYQQVVDILDEMTISGITRHILMEPNQKERNFMAQ
jgi:biopolymer transport protein ExbD